MTYYNHSQIINNFWKPLCDAHPGIASYEVAGYTYLNNPIWLFKIGNPNGGVVLFDGCMHGWEDMGTWVGYEFADWLLNSGDAKANQILQENYWLFIPVLNYDSTGRGNAHYTICPTYGVDLNRNFVTNWQYINDCGNTNNGIYGCVSGPPSTPHVNYLEPETITLRNVMNTYKPTGTKKAVYVNTHYGGGPWVHYAGNHNTSVWVPTRARILQIWGSEGNSLYGCKYPYLGALGMGDFLLAGVGGAAAGGASGDAAYVYGYEAFTIETYGRAKPSHPGVPCADGVPCGYDDPTWDEMVNKVSPMFRALWIAFSEAVAVTSSAPSCSTNGPFTGYVEDTIQFNGGATGGTPPYTYQWTFGDGATSTQQNPTHQYNGVGTYDVFFTVTDSVGQYATCSTTASIIETPDYDDAVSFTINVNPGLYEKFNDAAYDKQHLTGTCATGVPDTGVFTNTATEIQATAITRMSTCYIRKDVGALLDFTHEFDTKCSTNTGGPRCGYGLSTGATHLNYQNQINAGAGIQVYWRSGVLNLRALPNAAVTSQSLLMNHYYYLTLERIGAQVNLYIYLDSAKANLLQTLTTTVDASTTYKYLFPLMNYGNTTCDASTEDVAIENLRL